MMPRLRLLILLFYNENTQTVITVVAEDPDDLGNNLFACVRNF